MRAFLIGGFIALLGAGGAAAECRTQQDIIDHVKNQQPAAEFVIYTNGESEAIKAGIAGSANGALNGPRIFVVFSLEDWDKELVVGFKEGCMEDSIVVTRRQLDGWLAEHGAAQ